MRSERARFKASDLAFPDTVDELISRSQRSPLHSAAYLQLVAALHPRGDYNEVRNALYERSLVELQRVSAKAPFYRYFKARALANLNRRPAAIVTLGDPENKYETALLEALNGNLPELTKLVADSGGSGMDFLMFKDYQRVRNYYSDESEEPVDKFTAQNPNWAPFIQRAIRDYDYWARYSAASVKLGLEALMPADIASMETHLSGQLAVGEAPREPEVIRLVWNHIAEFSRDTTTKWLASDDLHTILSPLDVLELAETTVVANHLRAVEVDLDRRGLPDAALRKLASLESVLSGHPEVTFLRARSLNAKAEKSNNADEKRNLWSQAARASLNAHAWSGPLTDAGVATTRDYRTLLQMFDRAPEGLTYPPLAGYSRRYFEWPRAQGWFVSFASAEVGAGALQDCIDYTWTQFRCVRFNIDRESRRSDDPSAVRDRILKQNSHRFNGHPYKVEFDIEHARSSDDRDAELRLLEEQVNSGSTDWSMYYTLGRIYKRRGDYEEARDVWLRYPDFDTGDEPIDISAANYAGVAGAMLFWIGQHELATPLLEISASSRSGNAESMSATARLALIEGDLATAAEWSAARVRRYQSSYGLRDLLQILHITDQGETAWQIFDQVQANLQNTQMWSGALVGHRREGATISDISAWLAAAQDRYTAVAAGEDRQSIDLAQRYLLLAGTMDRRPGPELIESIAAAPTRRRPRYFHRSHDMETENGPVYGEYATVTYATGEYTHDRHLPNPPSERHLAHASETDTRYEMLSEAMTEFLNDDHESAYRLFNNTAYFYQLDEFLPYHAFSASVLGKADHILSALEKREWKLEKARKEEDFDSSNLGYRFDEDLTYGVIAALSGNHTEAITRLNAALNNRPYLNGRVVFPMYQLVDIADRLYEKTGKDGYRDFALELSRRHTVILPMYSWAYFVVAKYSDSQIDRRNAAASGLWLDPLSDRGRQLPKELKEEAQKLLDSSGPPFMRTPGSSTRRGA